MKKFLFFFILSLVFCKNTCYCNDNEIHKFSRLFRAVSTYDSLQFVKHDSIAEVIFNNYDLDSLHSYALMMKKAAIDRRYAQGYAKAMNYLAFYYYHTSQYDSIISNQKIVLNLQTRLNDKPEISQALNNIGWAYKEKGDYENALKYFFKALKIAEDMKSQKLMSTSSDNIGQVYSAYNQIDKALIYYQKALEFSKAINDKNLMARGYNNVAIAYRRMEMYDEAIKNYQLALELDEEVGETRERASTLGNIGVLYYHKGDYDTALKYYLQAIHDYEQREDKKGMALNYGRLAGLYYETDKLNLAIDYGERSIILAEELGSKPTLQTAYEILRDTYTGIGNYKKAYDYSILYSEIKDSIINESKIKQIEEMSAKYESEKKEKEIEILNKEKELDDARFQAKLEQEASTRNMYITGLTLSLILVIVILIYYRQRLRLQKKLNFQEAQMARQNAILEGQEAERERLAKELHDGLGGTLAGIKINMLQLKENHTGIELNEIVHHIGDACSELRTISHNLIPVNFSESKFTDTINNFIQNIERNGKIKISTDCYPENALNNLPKEMQLDIYRIIQELINNIIKHAEADKAEVSVFKEEDDLISIMVEDNGKGFPESIKKEGIGLKNIKARILPYKGTLNIDSNPNRGTAIYISMYKIEMNLTPNKYNLEKV